jgi:hypothetical protein
MVVPTVALLYLFCFIDRANIGKTFTPLCFTRYIAMVHCALSL